MSNILIKCDGNKTILVIASSNAIITIVEIIIPFI